MTPARRAGSSTRAARCRGDRPEKRYKPPKGDRRHVRIGPDVTIAQRRASYMTTMVKFSTKAGGQIEAALCEPPGLGKTGALVVVHEWHGLNEVMKLHCEHFAQAGFLALVPD